MTVPMDSTTVAMPCNVDWIASPMAWIMAGNVCATATIPATTVSTIGANAPNICDNPSACVPTSANAAPTINAAAPMASHVVGGTMANASPSPRNAVAKPVPMPLAAVLIALPNDLTI
ncbi:Uncharacterised protein [Chlamydia trachomatis]|nr:Uncharacterised protein [Chlamydia trachomatis]